MVQGLGLRVEDLGLKILRRAVPWGWRLRFAGFAVCGFRFRRLVFEKRKYKCGVARLPERERKERHADHTNA